MRNPAYGVWTEEETNWSEKEAEIFERLSKEPTIPTSYEQLVKECEESRVELINKEIQSQLAKNKKNS